MITHKRVAGLNRRNNRAVRLLPITLLAVVWVAGSPARSQSDASAVPAQKLAFEVATVRPSPPDSTNVDWDNDGDRITIKGYSLRELIKAAYDLKNDTQVVGAPDWLGKQRFDISTKISDEVVQSFHATGSGQAKQAAVRTMLQTLLEERFHLRVRPGGKKLPVFALVVGGAKARLTPSPSHSHNLSIHGGNMVAVATSMEQLATSLSHMREVGDRIVVDQTGLSGTYDFQLDWTPDRGHGVSEQADTPGLFTAIQEQLGLKLKPATGDVPTVEVLAADLPQFD